MIKIVVLSDTHGFHDNIIPPDGDILIHAGDATQIGTHHQVAEFADWMGSLPHQFKIFVAGNHDMLFENNPDFAQLMMRDKGIIYLQNDIAIVGGLKIWGSPITPVYVNPRWAFTATDKAQLERTWNSIPKDIDILVTHGPPLGFNDVVPTVVGGKPIYRTCGCELLRNKILEIKPKYHIFGHIHEGYGASKNEHTTFINASICNGRYDPVNSPIIFNYDETKYDKQ